MIVPQNRDLNFRALGRHYMKKGRIKGKRERVNSYSQKSIKVCARPERCYSLSSNGRSIRQHVTFQSSRKVLQQVAVISNAIYTSKRFRVAKMQLSYCSSSYIYIYIYGCLLKKRLPVTSTERSKTCHLSQLSVLTSRL